ncbi:hypothetical protein HOM13_03625 [Candidatus Woesearchaeota archaeon]|jgi:hypothetical protein|nr:hypothetical protein [Candidatus Woesearchaeota archaeon]MBT5215798.1 hypothetical protein [Candidatus Woesearchaeota archaeon]MBT6402157.1 hypothetical protein [Candidatus Woesearchaeota archaeon]
MTLIGVGTWVGLFGLLSLIPFLILYFIRPKPKEVVIPSLMFLGKSTEFRSKGGFFRKAVQDKVLLLQMLILLLISLFFAAPYLMTGSVGGGNVIMVLDTSASMSSTERFDTVISTAVDNLGDRNTIILVGSKPSVIVDGVDRNSAEKELKVLVPMDSRSGISGSLIFAKEKLEEISGEKAVVVVSDFLDTESGSVGSAIDSLKSTGVPLKIVSVETTDRNNVGIVSLLVRKTVSQAIVKNFCCEAKEIILDYEGKQETVNLEVGGTYEYNFEMVKGLSELNILNDDVISGDNTAYLNNQEDRKAKVVIITNGESKYLEAALSASSGIDLDVKSPGSVRSNYDLYILDKAGNIPSSLTSMLNEEVSNGKGVILVAEKGVTGDYGVFDFKVENEVVGGATKEVSDARFLDNVDFGRQSGVQKLDCGDCEGVFVAIDENPVVMIHPKGRGLVGYYGIEEESGFENKPDFPIFWTRFAQHLAGVRDLSGMNLKTGSSVVFGEEIKYETPSSKIGKGNVVVLNEAGFYKVDGLDYSANLLSEKESSLEQIETIGSEEGSSDIFGESELVKKSIWKELIMIAFVLLLFEWWLMARKTRRSKYHV